MLPEVVNQGEDGYRSLEYGKMVSVVVAAVKELYNKVLSHDEKIQSQDREIASVKAENAQLKAQAQKVEQENAMKTKELNAIKSYLCSKDPKAPICK